MLLLLTVGRTSESIDCGLRSNSSVILLTLQTCNCSRRHGYTVLVTKNETPKKNPPKKRNNTQSATNSLAAHGSSLHRSLTVLQLLASSQSLTTSKGQEDPGSDELTNTSTLPKDICEHQPNMLCCFCGAGMLCSRLLIR